MLGGFWWWQQSQQPTYRSMTDGTVTEQKTDGSALVLTVKYRAGSAEHSIKGRVDKAAFDWQGRSVWVCYDPDEPTDASLRLPYDPLCNTR